MNEKILEQIQARYEDDEEQQKLYVAFDDMDNLKWEIPDGWKSKEWIRPRINTDAHDALKQMANIFDTYNPKWEIMPLGEADKDRADNLAVWLEFFAQKANQAGETSPFRKGLHNSGKFNRVIYEVDYLPYWLPQNKKDWTPEQKANAQNGPFCFTAHDPRCIYYEIGKYGLKWVSNVSNKYGQDIIDHWSIYENNTEEGKQIAKGLKKIKSVMDDDEEACFIYVDYISNDKRCVAVFKTTQESTEDFTELDANNAIDILDGENKLGFIPYAIATGDSDPLLQSMHLGGIWENQNMIETIVDSSVLRRAYFPPIKHTSTTQKDLDIDFSGDQDVIELGPGETAETMTPPPIDPGLQQLASINAQRMGQTVGIRNLGLADIAGNVQFSTVQAQIQLQLTSLQPYKRTDEKALVQLALIMFRWIKKSGKTETAYRKSPGKDGQFKGENITFGPDDFDPDEMIITCELLSAAPTDKMQLVNMYSTLKQSGAQIAWGELLERLQLGNPEMLEQGWLDEQLKGTALKQFVDEQAAMLQLKVQAEQMKMQAQFQQEQMAMQQQAAQQGMPPEQSGAMANPSQQDAVMPGGQQNNPAAGGQPPMTSAPGMTRNNVRQPG